MNLTGVLYIVMAVIAVMLIIKFVIWLLPVIIMAVVAYMIYKSIKKNFHTEVSICREYVTFAVKVKLLATT